MASNPALFRIAVTVVVAAFVLAELLGWLPPITADSVQPNR